MLQMIRGRTSLPGTVVRVAATFLAADTLLILLYEEPEPLDEARKRRDIGCGAKRSKSMRVKSGPYKNLVTHRAIVAPSEQMVDARSHR